MNAKGPDKASTEEVSGLIERVTFHNEESGFCVLRVKVRGQRDEVTVLGSLPSVSAGEWLEAEGWWVRDKEHGLQFKARLMKTVPPTTVEGIERYLSSGLVKGIGPVLAKKLVGRFGAEVLGVIENRVAELQSVEGIGPKRRQRIEKAWQEAKQVRQIMLFLHSHGVSTSRAVRIFKTYGDQAIEKVCSNPYMLAKDIYGIGFATADQIAQKIGIPRDSLDRARAGIDHVLLEATSDGHCALPLQKLKLTAIKLLEISEETVEQALSQMLTSGSLLLEEIDGDALIFMPHLRKAEEGIAAKIKALTQAPMLYPPIDFEKAVTWCQQRTGKTLAPTQREALKTVLQNRVVVITGGPGVGKTTLVNSILTILRAKKVKCLLCAPTGRAAKRLTETTWMEAKTIHRLLEIDPGTGRFTRYESNLLACGLLVVDETSMVDVLLMQSLLRAIPIRSGLVLVGDVDQLPSVGPGTVLHDLIESGVVPVVRLTEVFRQAANSRIITNAHRIRQGQMPDMSGADPGSDFHFVERDDPEKIAATLVKMVQERIPQRFALDPIRDVQVLCPMNRGSLGVRELNMVLQQVLNPAKPGQTSVERFGWRFQIRDKVIQTENDYDKDVFNGDIGIVERIDAVEQQVAVRFDERLVKYDFGELDEISLAYAITIHKSQGSEFPTVVIPLATQHYMLLQRNLVYTGITRGKRLLVLVGQRKALAIAVHNDRPQRRYSGLLTSLRRNK
ncbi:MAG: ATP-dependent RecD-like DNA helicase [Acidobacteriota bacterium]|nr:ATP-dependent RecD-like DNA helicase [Acidobacteriota bacterium]